MPPTTNWYFEPSPDPEGDGSADRDEDTAPGLTCVPSALLQRHGARVLNPSDAPTIPGPRDKGWARTPRSTVYRARTLLIPGDLLRGDNLRAINNALAPVRMKIASPDPNGRRRLFSGPNADVLQNLPRVAVLVPAPAERGKPALPVKVDAWTALQALRAAADAAENAPTAPEVEGIGRVLPEAQVKRIALEHVLTGSAITGSPSTEGNGISGSPSTEGNGLTGPGSTDSYVYSGGDTRTPVTVCMCPPARREAEKLGSRRPVVAVLDTGVRAHPWLNVRRNPRGGYALGTPDGFVMDSRPIQNAIYAESRRAARQGDFPRVAVRGPWDRPVSDDPLLGELNDATGHGTFIAGIVRQVAPDAQVLAIRIMHSDDVVYEGDLLCALALLADRIAAAEEGDMAQMVDVVSLSLGYFDESAADVVYTSGLWQVIKLLLEMGVAVVAAAGNYSTSRRFYPAAFSLQPSAGPKPVISVGALNPNGSKALFSDGGRWVWAWAPGAAVVSTYPDDINGSRTPEVRVPAHPGNRTPQGFPADREALDPDNYRGGFATWSGTSFSAPFIAALIAAKLLGQAQRGGLGLDQPGKQAATERTLAALDALRQPSRALRQPSRP